jgi:endo-beta-N-acetylglucosaminidase D
VQDSKKRKQRFKQCRETAETQGMTRRHFIKVTGAAGAAMALTQPFAKAWSQTTPSIAPQFPGTIAGHPGLTVDSSAAISALLAYDPNTDPDAKYFRSRVPLAARIPAFAATQAQPKLSAAPQITNLSQYYESMTQTGNSSLYQYSRYGGTADPFVTRFQQYQDIVGGWQGAQAVPTIAYVDAAHRNGALVIGILFQPYFATSSGTDFVSQDASGNFLVGNKLVDLARYFGYDGYFLNIEKSVASSKASKLVQMFKSMQQRAQSYGMTKFHLQIYDSLTPSGGYTYQNRLDSTNVPWLTVDGINSMFVNYAWPQHFAESGYRHSSNYVTPSISTATGNGLNPFNTVYFGLDIEEENDGVHANCLDAYAQQVIPVNGSAGTGVASLALFDPSRRLVQRGINAAGSSPTPAALRTAVYNADRNFWSGSTQNPAQAPAAVIAITDTSIASLTLASYVPHYGVAQFIAERSVIGKFPFFTRFNTGMGDQFARDGSTVNSTAWYGMGIQDILPTWQWWTKSFYDSSIPAGLLGADYDYTSAFNGGNSLKISGALGPNNATELRLFKTKLALPSSAANHRLDLVYKLGQSGLTNLSIGLIFEDTPSVTTWCSIDSAIDFVSAAAGGGWTRATLNLSAYAGRTLAAISLGVSVNDGRTTAQAYSVNIGEMGVYDQAARLATVVAAPTGFAVESSKVSTSGTSAQLRLLWNFDPTVWYYDLYRPDAAGNPIWLGRISSDAYYVSAMPKIGTETSTTIQLVAVSADPTVSNSAALTFNW